MTRIRRTVAAITASALAVVLAAAAPAAADAAADTTPPTVSAVAVQGATVTAGDPMVLQYSAQDVGSGVVSVVASYQRSGGSPAYVSLFSAAAESSPLSAAGPAAGVVPVGAPPGVYDLVYVAVQDAAGNSTVYTPGTAVSAPAGKPALLDLSAAHITVVQPGTVDTTAPLLHSFSMLSSVDRRLGEFVTFDYGDTDEQSPVAEIRVFVHDPNGGTFQVAHSHGDMTAGRISLWLPTDVATGHWTVTGVTVTDSSGNLRSYAPNGAGTQTGRPDVSGPVFTGMGFDVSTGDTRIDPLRVLETIDPATVVTRTSASVVLFGKAVMVSGTVAFLGKAVHYPTLALYSETPAGRTLLGVVHGTASGAFSRRVVVMRDTVFRVVFLGSDRGMVAPQTIASGVRVRVLFQQAVLPAATSVPVRRGQVGVLTVSVVPRRANVAITLWRRVGTRWVTVTTVRTPTAAGMTSVRVARPASTTYYLWTTPRVGVYLAASSWRVTVHRV